MKGVVFMQVLSLVCWFYQELISIKLKSVLSNLRKRYSVKILRKVCKFKQSYCQVKVQLDLYFYVSLAKTKARFLTYLQNMLT